ncbi:Usher syndrome type-1G protein homolog [Diprion similis]|uniref:Usher syndrome type-1G protein homolog n=1 Tax=Diprion similis TaxID=362088 RepID=UPI001EF77F0D|nr:Usher syndrome type-1G protein homolog [Diprion similis]XP_046750498.1 Usher syndrome type-1G protein homolog [Diprion similis]XP_046750499.1 Usher syndrome type-1G protein homolog [Diprion similis]
MTSERFHKAARDGALEILKEATRRDCNARDDGGMTPTLWAAFEGNIDALRLLAARGGDPDKADYFGNTALHLAAARGHRFCVNFLVKFGCNIWALDIDRHSARELAAINGRDDILQFLDLAQTEQELNNRKKTKMLKERAEKEAEKRLKEYAKRQKMAEMRAEKEQKKLLKDKTRMMDIEPSDVAILPHRPSILTFKGRVKPSPTFSDIVSGGTKRQGGAVGRKVQARKAADDFKVGEIEMDGKRSVRSLTGLRRDSEVMYVGTYETHSQQMGKRGKISDVWGTLSRARSTPDLLGDRDRPEDDPDYDYNAIDDVNVGDTVLLQQPASIFNRPGFGSVAFRRPVTTTLDAIPIGASDPMENRNIHSTGHESINGSSNGHNNEEVSIGSAGSLARRQSMWDDDLISEEDDADEGTEEWTPLQRFLVANNLSSIHPILEAEQIDLEALMLLTDADVLALKLPLGPRRKLINAIAIRRRALENPSDVIEDSRL